VAKYGIAIDSANCMACYNCFMACKDEHCGFNTEVSAAQPHTGQFWMKITEWERGDDNRRIKTATVPMPCAHCEEAPCLKAAEDSAVYVRQDGIVIIDPQKAKGQEAIVAACPIGAVYWNADLQIPQKCTLCAHLLDKGYKEPRCVEACPNGALHFGDLDDPESKISMKIAGGRITPLSALRDIKTHVVHLNIPTVFFAGSVCLPEDEAAEGAQVTLTDKKSGEERSIRANYFGDWEFENLEKDAVYEIEISMHGFKTVRLTRKADADRFLGELTLERTDAATQD
jgi:Fe-S-cluster-containing dehydrogenase component